jgi:hypothetical protein
MALISPEVNLNREQAIKMNWSTAEETLDDCEKESRSTFYFISNFVSSNGVNGL